MEQDPENEARRLADLNAAVDRCNADNRHPSAIIASLLVAIAGDQAVTNMAIHLLDSMVFPDAF